MRQKEKNKRKKNIRKVLETARLITYRCKYCLAHFHKTNALRTHLGEEHGLLMTGKNGIKHYVELRS